MFAGHLAVGFAVKRMEPAVSLGTAILAAVLADLLCFVFLIAGVESFERVPGAVLNRMTGHNIIYSHSFAMDAVWAALFAAAFFLWKRRRRAAWLLFSAVLSHWVLDVVSHRPDMPLAPGIHPVLGFGLWNSVPATLLVEGGVWITAVVIYIRATGPLRLGAAAVFWSGIAVITLLSYANIRAGMDPDPVRAGVGGVILFSAMVAWAYGINRLHAACAAASS